MEKNGRKGSLVMEPTERWTPQAASDFYDVASWGKGYFSVGENGHVLVHPEKDPARSIDLKQLVDTLVLRGIALPILIRFAEILKHRLGEMHSAFQTAITEHKYKGGYCCVYPIKVNQQRQVVEEVLEFGKPYRFGLEAGSKPELLAVMALADNDTPIICNGFKDDEYIEMAMLAQKIGRQIIPVVEKYTELRPDPEVRRARGRAADDRPARQAGQPRLGPLEIVGRLPLEVRPDRHRSAARAGGAEGRWAWRIACKLLHFHLGSQITNIRQIKGAVNEAARVYVELERAGAGLKYLDVGGGLGIDYDGSQTDFESSVNYTLQEYANDVVYHIQNVCDEAEVPHPTIITESGRAIAAYHSVLVFNVLGVTGLGEDEVAAGAAGGCRAAADRSAGDLSRADSRKNLLESYHDAQQALDSALNLFSLGYLPLRAAQHGGEPVLGDLPARFRSWRSELDYFPEELEGLDAMLSDTYFCNFSLFQSMPDSWAVKQLFPIMPIHRLDEEPTRHGRAGRHHLRFRRQGGPVHRPPRREADAAAARLQRRAITTWARSWWARIRRSWAICTICSATPTPCTCG